MTAYRALECGQSFTVDRVYASLGGFIDLGCDESVLVAHQQRAASADHEPVARKRPHAETAVREEGLGQRILDEVADRFRAVVHLLLVLAQTPRISRRHPPNGCAEPQAERRLDLEPG